MTSKDKDKPTAKDLIKHVDHISKLVGIDFVGIGPDIIEPHNFLTKQGWLEGVFYVVRESHSVENVNSPEEMPQFMESFTDGLIEHGYKEADIKKILGENWLRVYEKVIG